MQWLSLALIIVLGGATMLTQSPRFLMVKPTIIPQNVPESTIVAAGYSWAVLLAALGLINLVIALNFDFMTWAWFISLGSVGSKFALFSLQYAVFRSIVRQRIAHAAG
jgi:intracellular septation protein